MLGHAVTGLTKSTIIHLVVLSNAAVMCAMELRDVCFAVVAQVEGHLHADSVPVWILLLRLRARQH